MIKHIECAPFQLTSCDASKAKRTQTLDEGLISQSKGPSMESEEADVGVSPFDGVPDEILSFIFMHLSPYGDLKSAARTCKRWNVLAKNVARQSTAQLVKAIQNQRFAQSCHSVFWQSTSMIIITVCGSFWRKSESSKTTLRFF